MPTRMLGHQFHPWKMPRRADPPSRAYRLRRAGSRAGRTGQQQEQQDPELGQQLDKRQALGRFGQPDLRLTEQHGALEHEGEPVKEALLQLGRQPHLLGLCQAAPPGAPAGCGAAPGAAPWRSARTMNPRAITRHHGVTSAPRPDNQLKKHLFHRYLRNITQRSGYASGPHVKMTGRSLLPNDNTRQPGVVITRGAFSRPGSGHHERSPALRWWASPGPDGGCLRR